MILPFEYAEKLRQSLRYQKNPLLNCFIHPLTSRAMKITRDAIEVKPYSITELAAIYNMTRKTINKWLKPHESVIGKRIGRYYTVKQVVLIFELIELPGKVED